MSTSLTRTRGTPHSIPSNVPHERVAEEVLTHFCYPGADRLDEETLLREERKAREHSERNYLEAAVRERNDTRWEQSSNSSAFSLSHSNSSSPPYSSSSSSSSSSSASSSSASSSSSSSSSPQSTSLPTSFPHFMSDSSLLYGPDVYDFLELLHEVNVAYSMCFRNFSEGYVRVPI